jgi:hypothetical protein
MKTAEDGDDGVLGAERRVGNEVTRRVIPTIMVCASKYSPHRLWKTVSERALG